MITTAPEEIDHLILWLCDIFAQSPSWVKEKSSLIVQTPWSVVMRLMVNQDTYYLKKTPPGLFIEAEIIRLIGEKSTDAPVPNVLFKNESLFCFLTNSVGDQALRTKFNGTLHADLLIQGFQAYITIQRSLETYSDDFIGMGVPDWRISRMPALYVELIEKKERLIEEGLTTHDINQLMKAVTDIESSCQLLSQYPIKETLVNCDINENNMIINEATQKIAIIDWGESVISHPFFSIASHLQSIIRRYALDTKGDLVKKLEKQLLSSWLDVINKNELNQIYNHIQKIHPIFSALALYRLQWTTNHQSKKMQRWFIKDEFQKIIKKQN